MKLYIAKSHKDKGYFITAQKDGKMEWLKYTAGYLPFTIINRGNGIPRVERALRRNEMRKVGLRKSMPI